MSTSALPPVLPAWVDRGAYPFESRFARLPRGWMHYVDEGHGPVLLLVHGTPTWSFEFRRLISALRARYRVIAPDHLGFGLSERPAGLRYTPEEHAENLRAFVQALGLDDFTLVVHDFGGPIGLPLALEPDSPVRRLVVLNSWMWPFTDDPKRVRTARFAGGAVGRALYRWANLSLEVLMPGAYGDRRKLTPQLHWQYLAPFRDRAARVQVLHALARSLLTSSAHYDALWSKRGRLNRVPTLIVWGLADSAFRPPQLDRWRGAVPHAEVVALEGAGHWPHEEAPDEVRRALERFLAATEGQRERAAAHPV